MKHLKLILAAVVIVMSFAACKDSNNNGVPDTVPGASEPLVSEIPDVLDPDDWYSSDMDDWANDNNGAYSSDYYDYDNDFFDSSLEDYYSSDFDVSRELSQATMSTDFSKIGALDGQKVGWGPGNSKDEQNRPTGALDFQNKYGGYNADFIGKESNKMYLTFDEGYEYENNTEHILDTLKDKKATAVFFVTYTYAKNNPELIRRMIDEGHIVGNHSTKHLSFPDMPLQEAAEDIIKLHNYMLEKYNYTMELFRFPMGEFSEQTLAVVESLGYRSVFWSFAYQDWFTDKQPDPDEALKKISGSCHPGGILLLHAVSATNTEILGECIEQIRDRGYEIVPYDIAQE